MTQKFAPTTPGASLTKKSILNALVGVVTVAGVVLAASNPATAVYLGVAAGLGAPAISIWNDSDDAKETEELSVLKISDILPDLKKTALAGFEASHNATFSNGQAGGVAGATVRFDSSRVSFHVTPTRVQELFLTYGLIDEGCS